MVNEQLVFPVGQVCNLSGKDAILSYDYFCDGIIRHAGVNNTQCSRKQSATVDQKKSWQTSCDVAPGRFEMSVVQRSLSLIGRGVGHANNARGIVYFGRRWKRSHPRVIRLPCFVGGPVRWVALVKIQRSTGSRYSPDYSCIAAHRTEAPFSATGNDS
jgi:hypothetical protein